MKNIKVNSDGTLSIPLVFSNNKPAIYSKRVYSDESIELIKNKSIGLAIASELVDLSCASVNRFATVHVENLIGECVGVEPDPEFSENGEIIDERMIIRFRPTYPGIPELIEEIFGKDADVYLGPRSYSHSIDNTRFTITELFCYDLLVNGRCVNLNTIKRMREGGGTLPVTGVETKKQGRLIVFEGPDKSGKSTQQILVADRLRELGYKVFTYHFPDYTSETGKAIKNMLTDSKIDLIHNREHQFVFAETQVEDKLRYKPELLKKLEEYDFVILDRLTLSSVAYDFASFTSCYKTGRYGPMENLDIDLKYFELRYEQVLEGLDVEWVFFFKSKLIETACADNNRALDNLDKDDEYQKAIDDKYREIFASGKYHSIATIDTDDIWERYYSAENENKPANKNDFIRRIAESIVFDILRSKVKLSDIPKSADTLPNT